MLHLVIADPYNILTHRTKPTQLGKNVIRCFLAGDLLLLYDPSGNALAAEAQAL